MIAMVRQQGYNLVEMMIALVVLGLVIGGALVPLQVRFEQEEINSAKKHLAQAKEAVLAYALRHGTTANELTYYDDTSHTLPANRPYLPCPDIDNDGLEDRKALPTAFPVAAAMLPTAGACEQQKGMLPWKTLGVRGLDPWGNRLTYRVDQSFSSQLYGFDETFRADIFDVAADLVITAGDRYYPLRSGRDFAGAVICSRLENDGTTGGCPQLDLANMEAGVVSTLDVDLRPREIPAYDTVNGTDLQGIIEGPVFVIVSHGKDGHGAINRSGACRVAPPLTTNVAEIANAYYRPAHPFLSPPFDCVIPATTAELYENMFTTAPISGLVNAAVNAPDDLITWAGGNELFGVLARGGRLPLAKLGYLP